MDLSSSELNALRKVYSRMGDAAWEPQDARSPLIEKAIKSGFMARSDGRCGFERLRDSHVRFTMAGRMALQAVAELGVAVSP
ncbi:hypothetical protein SAMN02983003_3146 [Devosia enhydra]|uniref:Uncharacterized protein n=1 Tax=Devosia enhydra TaxID=665118 RepID=A0A1K2I0S5_9HYPH|nr:hypothetical protein [Devosia enhydra]SFZ85974.1 hypothetical protein SAMN02983003_3146 [Devosia enhydra]